ncbi:MAG TPA: 6-phosphogluconolactonase [Gemmatimonadaceae bacterium]|nr:6-phosphogluconolactonase [Gemmatimonadaceae bacterium]
MTKDRIVVVEEEAFPDEGARRIARRMRESVEVHGGCAMALAGGATPRPVYERLAALSTLDADIWERTEIYFGDERCVPPDDPASNYRMAQETLLSRVPVPASQVYRMHGEESDRDSAARAYAHQLPSRLDVLILGMGIDGHTASLFPRTSALDERTRAVVPADAPPPAAPVHRLTITPPVIARAQFVIVLVAGADKAPTLAQVLEGPTDVHAFPVQFARAGLWVVDRSAASRLRVPPQ